MPVIDRTDDALTAAKEMWEAVDNDHTYTAHCDYMSVRISVHWCADCRQYECALTPVAYPSDVIGVDVAHDAGHLARVIDAVMCLEMMVHNRAAAIANEHQNVTASDVVISA